MTDQKQIITGLQEAAAYFRSSFDAMYGTVACEKFRNWTDAIEQAIALLKAQEPRLVTEADFENADPYGYLSVWVEDKDDNEIICDCITKYAITEPDEDYHYRYWTSRPTDEQRKAVKWE